MIDITLKASHLRLVAYLLRSIVAGDVFSLLNELKAKVTSSILDEDDVTVTVKPEDFTKVYAILSEMQEGLVAAPNKEMNDQLLPQVMSGIQGPQASEWGQVAQFIQDRKTAMTARLGEYIVQGGDFLNG